MRWDYLCMWLAGFFSCLIVGQVRENLADLRRKRRKKEPL